MAELAYKSLDIWNELERDAGVSLRSMTGLLNFGDPNLGEGTPEGECQCQKLNPYRADVGLGTLLGPIDNLKELGMQYQECKTEPKLSGRLLTIHSNHRTN